ncbi:MAG: hypothetical protein GOMPHAMPRED_003798 [Gomphillus americanus]|uniref:RADC family protein n=1 Tax=Gomphillus americanus TaxID=1940652 RepID=A0A8H3FKE2_9LECA|nr:MAG: hypothetical protein GOMPHAMPRED_003798 [Gomphillus americanus]
MASYPYVGNGPYCYANCLAMMLGANAPSSSVIEVATCSPFGMQIIEGLPFFDPTNWDPLIALDDTLKTLGWSSKEFIGKDAENALKELKSKLHTGPVFVGPVDLSYLSYQPGPRGADHYVVVLVVDDMVHLHDPNGHPYAILPVKDFLSAWGASLPYGQPFTMRYDFRKLEDVTEDEIIRRTLPNARRWLSEGNNREAAETAAKLVKNWHPALYGHMTEFAIRVGARRVADAAICLERIGYRNASKIMTEQAKLLGSLQYHVRVKNSTTSAEVLSHLGLTYEPLVQALKGDQGLSA